MEFTDNMLYKSVCKMKKVAVTQVKTISQYGKVSCWSITAFMGVMVLVITAYIFSLHIASPDYSLIYIGTQGPLHVVNENFLSLGLDSSIITERFKNFNMTDPKLIKMMKYLSPAYIRIGGNQADQILFCNRKENDSCISENENGIFNVSEIFTLSGSDWLKLHKLANSANLDVIYDLNSLLRFENGSWNSRNAEEMIQFSQDNGLKLDWELGNEPNSYEHKFHTSVSATQLGNDYSLLKEILFKHELYRDSFLVGPSTTRLRTKDIEDYFTEFLVSGSRAVKAITWHHYYFSGINATADEFLNPNIFNYLRSCIGTVNFIVREFLELDNPVWLGETSSAWHAGAPNLSDRFIAGFLWIDKLGLSAQMGIDVVVRQSIFKGHYALINDSYYPNPDWWLSVLYKKLVGTSVVLTSCLTGCNEKIRVYAHCAKNSSSIVVLGVNFGDRTGFVKIDNLHLAHEVEVYEITSEGSLFSQYVRLNGEVLNLLPNLELPELKPKRIVRDKVFAMPAYSVVFWVFADPDVRACSN